MAMLPNRLLKIFLNFQETFIGCSYLQPAFLLGICNFTSKGYFHMNYSTISEICCTNIRIFIVAALSIFFLFSLQRKKVQIFDYFFLVPARRPLNGVQIYVLQNSLLLAKLVFKGSSKHSSCNKVLQASCLPSRFHKTKFS